MLEELATPRMEVTGEYLRVVSCGAGMAMVAWSVRSGEFLELRCRCDGDGTLRIFPLEGRSGATLVQLEPANAQWEYTVGTGGQAFRALLSPQRVSLSGIDPLLPSIDPFARQ